MKIVCISDTHGLHEHLVLPNGDMLIHAGDISQQGEEQEIRDFLKWFSRLNYQHKIFIAGNHDFFFERSSLKEINKIIPEGIHYLQDSGITIEGINIWGSPIQPWFMNWAFNRFPGEQIRKHWDLIPENTDILITHGPPYGILDKTILGERAGCLELRSKLESLSVKAHIFGHIHEANGEKSIDGVNHINASVVDQKYQVCHKPFVYNHIQDELK